MRDNILGTRGFFSRCSAEDTSEKCDEELCCLRPVAEDNKFEDSKPETAHEKPLAPRVTAQMQMKKIILFPFLVK